MHDRRKLGFILATLLVTGYWLRVTPTFATEYSSTNFKVLDPVINDSGGEMTSTSYRLRGVVGELAPARSASSSFTVRSGSVAFPSATVPTLTATGGPVQVSLSWTASSGALGWTIGGYDVCQGTTSNSYTCTDVGNVISSTRGSLTAGTQYFFRVRAKDAFGNVVVRSAEASATPSAGGSAQPPVPPPPETTVRDVILSGRAYSSATVSLFQNGSVVRTIVAETDGTFRGVIQNVSVGTYTFGVSARDASSRVSPLLTYTINVAGTQVTIENIFLAPTVTISSSAVTQGDVITAQGVAFPASTVRVQIPSVTDRTAMTSNTGAWSVTIPTNSLTVGTHTLRARAEVGDQASELGAPLTFTVASVPPPPAPVCRGADLNEKGVGDGKVNAQDVSILLSFWKKSSFSDNPCADTNRDGIINLKDLSILLFLWTG